MEKGETEAERQTNSSIGQMYVSVSGLLGCPQAARPYEGKPQWGRIQHYFFFFCLHSPVKYLFICVTKQNARQGHHLHSNTFIVINLLHSHREFN